MDVCHVVFDFAAAKNLRSYFDEEPSMRGSIIKLLDDFSIGPLCDLTSEDGLAARRKWWQEIFHGCDEVYEDGHQMTGAQLALSSYDNTTALREINSALKLRKKVIVWCGPHARDELSLLYLVTLFRTYRGLISVVRFPAIKLEEGTTAITLGDIPSERIKDIEHYESGLSVEVADSYVSCWEKLSTDNEALVRLRVAPTRYKVVPVAYYDKFILGTASLDYSPAHKVVTDVIQKLKLKSQHVNLDFLLWRVRVLIEEQKLGHRGASSQKERYLIRRERYF